MCRIFLTEDPSKFTIDRLISTFTNLDNDAGGDGVGIGYYLPNGEPHVQKGKDITPENAAYIIAALPEGTPVMVHFRAASPGTATRNYLAHPFITNEGIFCQNGSVFELIGATNHSDTFVIKELINNSTFEDVAQILNDYGVLAILRPNGLFDIFQSTTDPKIYGHRPWEDLIENETWVGISNKDCWKDKVVIEKQVKVKTPAVVVGLTDEEWYEWFGTVPPEVEEGNKHFVSVPAPYVEKFSLEAITVNPKKFKRIQDMIKEEKTCLKS